VGAGQPRLDITAAEYAACNLIMDNYKIIIQFCGDIRWNHIIYDGPQRKFVSNIACCILIVSAEQL
jgi:hypothetical protein